MATTLNDQIGRVLGGRYRLVAPIGSGASAQVFLADDTTLRRRVAVKVLHEALVGDETFLRRFQAEARAAASMNHAHILVVYDWGEDDVPYLVTEYLGGGSLRAMLDAGHRLSVSQALLVGLEAARGLEYAHRRGFVHRDIKPANLLFDEDARLRVADFGIARALAEAGWTEPEGAVVGTVRYASPEQAKGEPLTGKSDVYALALVINEAVTGQVPFTADTALGTLMARVDQQLPVGPELGPLRRVLERAGRPDPDDRPDAGEFIIGLMAAAEELDKPEPLPLVGTLPKERAEAAELDATRHADAGAVGGTGTHADRHAAHAADLTAPIAAAPEATRVFQREERAPAPRAEPPAGAGDRRAAVAADRKRRRWPWVLLAVLLVAGIAGGGTAAYFLTRTVSHDVPDMRGWTETEVQALIEKNHWAVGDRLTGRSDQYRDPGQIIATDPASGKLAEGKPLTYTVSIGPELVGIPDIVGATLDAAKQQLEGVGLKLADPAKHEYSEDVPAGQVIRIEGTDRQLPRGSTVQVTVSDGPQPRVIPAGVENQQFEAVQKQLTDLGLQVQRADDYSDTVQTGRVIGLRAADGTPVGANAQVPKGTAITVVVSKGPAPRAIPNVVGKSLAQAVDAMKQAGFTVTNISGDVSKPVLASDPPAGEIKPYGTQVRLIMRST